MYKRQSLYYDYVTLPKRVTRFAPLQFLGQPATTNDHSQFLRFLLPLLGFPHICINLGIHFIHLLIVPLPIASATSAVAVQQAMVPAFMVNPTLRPRAPGCR